jgi:hypothetical protein
MPPGQSSWSGQLPVSGLTCYECGSSTESRATRASPNSRIETPFMCAPAIERPCPFGTVCTGELNYQSEE